MKLHILLTSVGRRGYLVKYFKDALGDGGKIYAANSIKCSAFVYADQTVITPLIYDEKYIKFLKDYCIDNNINAIISLFDIDLLMLAKHKKEFVDIGVTVIVSSEKVIEICNDKWKTYKFLKSKGFYTPDTYINVDEALKSIAYGTLQYPIVLKPRWGMGSIAVYTVENDLELRVLYEKVENQIKDTYLKFESDSTMGNNVLIQEKVRGQEYGMDIINDLKGEFQINVVKKKYAMRSGETDCAITVQDRGLEKYGEKISTLLKHIGNLDVDIIYDGEKSYILDMNARFGGGYPFTHAAGVDLPRAIIAWLNNDKCNEEWLKVKYNVFAYKDISITKELIKYGDNEIKSCEKR